MGRIDGNSGVGRRHFCVLCLTPGRRALCGSCFDIIPEPIRDRFSAAHAERITRHREYQEAQIELLMWLRSYDGRNEWERDV